MKATASPEVPIACTLGIGAFKERLEWNAELNARRESGRTGKDNDGN